MITKLYQKTRTGKIQEWSIWVKDIGASGYPEVWIEHGQTDGKKQTTFDIIDKGVNEGKSNETTPLQQANLVMERKITKQLEHGYVKDPVELDKELKINFNEPLPKELCFYKPKNNIEDSKIKELESTIGRAIYTVKRDGMMHVIRKTKKFGVEIYSRTMDLVTDKYPHLIEPLSNLFDGTILLGEMVLIKDDKDDFNSVSRICRPDADLAVQRQEELGKVSYYVFDVAYFAEKNMLLEPYIARRALLNGLKNISDYIIPSEIINKPHNQALQEVMDRKLEGIVIYDASGKMKDGEGFTLNGKAYRPNVLWKSKPKYEDDFIVRFDPENKIGEFGSGKNHGKLKSVFLYQLDDDGNEIMLSKCGGGLTDEQRDFYTTAEYPRVWRVEFDSIQPGTGSLRFPVFNADRTLIGDKDVKECLMSEQVKKAKEEQEEDE